MVPHCGPGLFAALVDQHVLGALALAQAIGVFVGHQALRIINSQFLSRMGWPIGMP
jgi:hypothetical protein